MFLHGLHDLQKAFENALRSQEFAPNDHPRTVVYRSLPVEGSLATLRVSKLDLRCALMLLSTSRLKKWSA